MKKTPKLLVVGSFVMDLISHTERMPSSGETILGESFSMAPGGKGANQAIQAARLGANVTMVGRVGNDDFGRRLVASAREAGVQIDHVLVDLAQPSAIGNVLLEKDNKGRSRNRIVVIPGANMMISPRDVSFLQDCIGNYDMVLLQHEIPQEVNQVVTDYAYAAGVPVMLNPAPSAEIPDSLIKKLEYISPNEHELEALTGICVKKDNVLKRNDLHRAVDVLHERGAKNVVVTLGDCGAVVSDGEDIYYSPCVSMIQSVDPTAAGDSFVGAFCTAVCSGIGSKSALTFANYVASLTVSKIGAQPSLPYLNEVEDLLERLGESREMMSMVDALSSGKIPNGFNEKTKQALEASKELARNEVNRVIEDISIEKYEGAVRLIEDSQFMGGRVHITGIGKPSHVANYVASLLSSTGTPAYFLHGTEAVHGSSGQLMPGDVVICISNSGETEEMKATVTAIKRNHCKVIGVTGNAKSWLAEQSDVHLFAGVEQEGGPLNRAPRNSVLAEMLVLQGLSVVLQVRRGLTSREYIRWHPGGALGSLRENEK